MARDDIATKLARQTRLALIAAARAAALLGPGAAVAMAEANFLGTWIPSPGQVWTVTSQSGGSCTGTTTLGEGWTFSECHVSGNNYEFTVAEEGYSSHNHGVSEGNKLTGEFNDTHGDNVPYTAVREGSATSVTGEILDENYKAVAGVTVMLTGTSETSESISLSTKTSSAGKYSFEPPPGTYSVTAGGDPENRTAGPWRS